MKKSIFIAALATLISIGGMAQSPKGPKAKNQKAWEKESSVPVFLSQEERVNGPKAKNTSVQDQNREAIALENDGPNKLKGPKYKNQKPFNNGRGTMPADRNGVEEMARE